MSGLYIHVPFCGQLCTYCDFHFSVSLSKIDEMVLAMMSEMHIRRDYLSGEAIDTLYFGGGTPSILSISQLQSLIHAAQSEFGFVLSQLSEFTLECNPEDLSDEYLKGLKELGVTRLSIGIQSFNDNILKVMNRRHNAEKAIEAVQNAKNGGFTNISVDLIFGVPQCDDDMLFRDLQYLLELNTQHISVYHLTIEENTVLGWKKRKGIFSAVDEVVSDKQYKMVEDTLVHAGYEHYEISNYALPGYRAKHNSGYWNGTYYVGIGPSAHSFDGVSRQWNVAGNIRYMDAIKSGSSYFEREELTADECYDEYVMTSLRTAEGVVLSEIRRRWGADRLAYFLDSGRVFFDSGVLVREDDRVRIVSSKFLLSDNVIMNLMI